MFKFGHRGKPLRDINEIITKTVQFGTQHTPKATQSWLQE